MSELPPLPDSTRGESKYDFLGRPYAYTEEDARKIQRQAYEAGKRSAVSGEAVAWLVHAKYPYVTMDPPFKGGLPRTPLYTHPTGEVEKDAARYRWLRDMADFGTWQRIACVPAVPSSNIDSVIDAAMEAKNG